MKIPLNASTYGKEEINAALEVLESTFVTFGKNCLEFEKKFADKLGVKNAVFVNSGSSANLLAFFALANPVFKSDHVKRLEPGFEVIVPAVTWSTTIWPIVQAGGVPVLVDSDPKTFQIDPKAVEEAISDKTVGICPVHVLGNTVNLDAILNIAEEYKLWVVEDTCEALGSKYKGKYAGTFGEVGTYSFFFSHHITTIEGGMIVTDNDDIAELCRCMRAHGWTRHLKNREVVESKYPQIDPRFLFINQGFSLRPTEIQAAFGLIQLDKLDGFNQKRVEISEKWNTAFKGYIDKELFVPMQTTTDAYSTYFGYPIVCKTKKLRDKFQKYLEENGVETRPVICGNLARQPAFEYIPHRIGSDLAGADKIMDHGLFWGSHPIMTEEETDYIIKIVHQFFNN